MAIYTTFFLCELPQLLKGFPDWKPPLPKPVRREFKNPFTGEWTTVESHEPEWADKDKPPIKQKHRVVSIKGKYENYLEGRLPSLVQTCPHWAAKGLTNLELNPLAKAIGLDSELEYVLYAPPSSGAWLQEILAEVVSKLAVSNQAELKAIATRWAATMSTAEYTHSVSGVKLSDGWQPGEAMEILRPLVDLARQAGGKKMYLLIET